MKRLGKSSPSPQSKVFSWLSFSYYCSFLFPCKRLNKVMGFEPRQQYPCTSIDNYTSYYKDVKNSRNTYSKRLFYKFCWTVFDQTWVFWLLEFIKEIFVCIFYIKPNCIHSFQQACFYIINLYTEQCNVFSIYFNYSSIRSRYFLSTFDFRPITFCMITGVFLTFNVVFVGVSLYNEACNNNINARCQFQNRWKKIIQKERMIFFL